MDLFKPEYNIAEIAGYTLGYKHTPKSLAKMRDFVLSDEVRDRKALSTANATAARRISIMVENTETKVKQKYTSLTEAGYALGVSKASVSQALINNRKKHIKTIKLYYLLNGWFNTHNLQSWNSIKLFREKNLSSAFKWLKR